MEKIDQEVPAQTFEEQDGVLDESSTQSIDGSLLSTDVSASETENNDMSDNGNDDHGMLLITIIKSIPNHILQSIADAFSITIYMRKEGTIQSFVKLAETNKEVHENLILAHKQLTQFKKEKELFLDTKTPQEMVSLLLEYGVSVKKNTRSPRIRSRLMKYYIENEFTFTTNPAGNITVCI